MKIERTIGALADEATVRERICAYFAFSGYVQTGDEPRRLRFARGSWLAFSPRGWKVAAVVELAPGSGSATGVTVAFDVSTTCQYVITSERLFWQNEMNDLDQMVRTGKMVEKSRTNLPMRAKSVVLGLTGAVLVLALALLLFRLLFR